MQLLEAAEAKASFGLVSNWSGLNKIVDHLVEHETLSGTQLAELLHQNEGMFFPDPFVEGFGFNDDREIVFPGSEEVILPVSDVMHQTNGDLFTTRTVSMAPGLLFLDSLSWNHADRMLLVTAYEIRALNPT